MCPYFYFGGKKMIEMYGYNNGLQKTINTQYYDRMLIFVHNPMQLEYDLLCTEFDINEKIVDKLRNDAIEVYSDNKYALAKFKVFTHRNDTSFVYNASAIFNENTIIIVSDKAIDSLYNIINENEPFEKYIFLICDTFIDSYIIFLNKINTQILNNENNVNELLNIYKQLLEIKKFILLEREIFDFLIDSTGLYDNKLRPFLINSVDKFISLTDIVDIEIEHLKISRDKYRFDQASDLDKVMKRLTSLTALFSLPMLITGIYGMNFDNTGYGFYCIIGFILLTFSVLAFYFRKNKWI